MKLSDLNRDEFTRRLQRGGIVLQSGPFTFRMTVQLPALADGIRLLYAEFPLGDHSAVDFHIRVKSCRMPLSFGRYAEVFIDGQRVFAPFPRRAAMPNFEWALNWWIYNYAHHFLMIHAGVVARNGHALILSGLPGAGKSTLCAALTGDGWRLMSDELALLAPGGLDLSATARPIGLKDDSIDVIARRLPDASFGPLAPDTHKGTIAHLKPPRSSVEQCARPATPRWLCFPRFDAAADTRLEKLPKARAFMELAENAFNYRTKGHAAFQQLAELIDACECYRITFSSLDEALTHISDLCGLNSCSGS